MNDKTIKKLESGRAEFAYSCALQGKDKKEYKSYVKKLPMLIKTNGLASALSFYFANGTKKGKVDKGITYGLIYDQIESWLKKDNKKLIDFDGGELVKKLLEIDSFTYRAVTIEVMAFLNWLRRFAEALSETD